MDDGPAIALFSDEPGWHGRALQRAFEARGFFSQVASLTGCSLNLSEGTPVIEIPGFVHSPKAAFVRGVPGGTLEEVIVRLNILHALQHDGITVFNSGRAIERTVDKSLTTFLLRRAGIPTPRTWIMESKTEARQVANELFNQKLAMVVKPLFGSQGKGVMKIDTLNAFDQYVPPAGVYYIQEYVEKDIGLYRDWRIFVVAGRAIAAMERQSEHWVTNRARGAECVAIEHDQGLFRLAEAATKAMNVDYAGVDVLRDRNGQWLVGEVNGIPAWQGLQRVSKVDITAAVADAFIEKFKRTDISAAAG